MIRALILLNLKHVVRSRLLILHLVFSFILQFICLRMLRSVSINIDGLISEVGPKQALFLGLFLQLFNGAFLTAVYGIFLVPYLHQGHRGQLTFTLPVSKWVYPLVYGSVMLALLLVQYLSMFLSYGMLFGFSVFLSETFQWRSVIACLAIETLAFETILFALACSSLFLGQIPTFFFAGISLFVLQLIGAVLRIDFEKYFGAMPSYLEALRWVYSKFPPLGELVFNLNKRFSKPVVFDEPSLIWVVWLVLFLLLFRWKIRYPSSFKGTET
jgi:hypothetical protein